MNQQTPKNITGLVNQYSPDNQQLQQREANPAPRVPQELQTMINKVVSSIDGMYQFSGFRNNTKLDLYKAELTKALYKVRDKVNEQSLKAALDLFRTKGGKFPPSVPEFIQAVLGEHEEQIKAPEHHWFDASKALPKYSAEQMSEIGKHGIELARAALQKKLIR
ncbi:hypothetical protein [Colwellia sp. MEBiC06753]